MAIKKSSGKSVDFFKKHGNVDYHVVKNLYDYYSNFYLRDTIENKKMEIATERLKKAYEKFSLDKDIFRILSSSDEREINEVILEISNNKSFMLIEKGDILLKKIEESLKEREKFIESTLKEKVNSDEINSVAKKIENYENKTSSIGIDKALTGVWNEFVKASSSIAINDFLNSIQKKDSKAQKPKITMGKNSIKQSVNFNNNTFNTIGKSGIADMQVSWKEGRASFSINMNVLSAPIKTSNKGRKVDTSYSPAAKVITWQGTTLRFVIDLFETSLSKIGKASITPFEISFLRINNHTQWEKDSKEMKKIRSSWESSVAKNYMYLRRITWLLLFDRYFNYNNTLRNSQKSSRKKVVIKDLILGVGINNEFYEAQRFFPKSSRSIPYDIFTPESSAITIFDNKPSFFKRERNEGEYFDNYSTITTHLKLVANREKR